MMYSLISFYSYNQFCSNGMLSLTSNEFSFEELWLFFQAHYLFKYDSIAKALNDKNAARSALVL